MKERTVYTQPRPEEHVVISSMKLQRESTLALGYTTDSARALHARRRSAAKPIAKLDVNGVAWNVVLTLLDWTLDAGNFGALNRRPAKATLCGAPAGIRPSFRAHRSYSPWTATSTSSLSW